MSGEAGELSLASAAVALCAEGRQLLRSGGVAAGGVILVPAAFGLRARGATRGDSGEGGLLSSLPAERFCWRRRVIRTASTSLTVETRGSGS